MPVFVENQVAQWIGQFSGHTHATRVQDAEIALLQAVVAFRNAQAGDALEVKAKAVRRLAERLLASRVRLLKARLVAKAPLSEQEVAKYGDLESLRRRETELRVAGVDGVLAEFGVLDVRK